MIQFMIYVIIYEKSKWLKVYHYTLLCLSDCLY